MRKVVEVLVLLNEKLKEIFMFFISLVTQNYEEKKTDKRFQYKEEKKKLIFPFLGDILFLTSKKFL